MKWLIALLLLTTGCASFKHELGDYVTDAVSDTVTRRFDEHLTARGLSVGEIKSVLDLNQDDKVDEGEIVASTKAALSDLISARLDVAEARYAAERQQAAGQFLTSRDAESMWLWLKAAIGGLIAMGGSYLTKQVFSAKADGRRDARLALLEKATGKDLDGDGRVGDARPA